MNIAELETALRKFVADGSRLDSANVIPGNDKGPSPKTPYATVLYRRDIRAGYPSFEQRDGTTLTTTQERTSFSVQWYRLGATQLAHHFKAWASSELGLSAAEVANFRVVFPLTIRRLDSEIDDQFEERAQVDLPVDWLQTADQNTGRVDIFQGTFSAVTILIDDSS